MSQNQGYLEIDIRELFGLLLKKCWIIILCVIIAAGASGYYSYTRLTDYYSANATIFLGKEATEGTIDLGTISLNNQLMSDYMSLINSRLVADTVVDRLDLKIPGQAIQYAINAYSNNSDAKVLTRMFTISYQSADPILAADIVNTTCNVVIEKAKEIFGVDNAQVVDTALIPQYPIGPNRNKNIMIAALAGAVFGIIFIFGIEFLDRTFKKPRDIERVLGLTVLGTIPYIKGEKREKTK